MRLGHVHLKVNDLGRSERFYQEALGLRITERIPGVFSFMSSGDAHHEIALQQSSVALSGGKVADSRLYHVAFELPNEQIFVATVKRMRAQSIELSVVDHRISWAAYLSDPDGNGIEVYVDRRNSPGGARLWGGASRQLKVE